MNFHDKLENKKLCWVLYSVCMLLGTFALNMCVKLHECLVHYDTKQIITMKLEYCTLRIQAELTKVCVYLKKMLNDRVN